MNPSEEPPQPGNRKGVWGLDINAPVFLISSGLIVTFVALSLIFRSRFRNAIEHLQADITHVAGWFFILVVNIYLIAVIVMLCSRFGHIRLGGKDARPDFSYLTWFAMLFSAGMGIGLVFFSVAEPMYHFLTPPFSSIEPASTGAAERAMIMTFYHWGFHAWGIYALVGLALAFFAYNKKLPLTIRSAFYPILGKRIHGPIGNLIDILAVVATLFGVATSLGIGVKQVNAGLNFLYNVEQSVQVQVLLIALITMLATVSVVTGVKKGIRILSEINISMATLLLFFVLFAGPTLFILNALVQNIGNYLQDFIHLSTWTETYQRTDWQSGWTIFYWAWWIAWSPFVGMFIARVSRGRTIREFLLGVLLVPTCVTFIWLTVFGNAAVHAELFGQGGIAAAVQENLPTALFELLSRYPLEQLTGILAVIVIVIFFVTSSDSGSLVIDIITAGGNTNPPVQQRVFWALMEGVVAAVLLLGGGLQALQTASITTGLPFAIVLLVMTYSLWKGLQSEVGAPGDSL